MRCWCGHSVERHWRGRRCRSCLCGEFTNEVDELRYQETHRGYKPSLVVDEAEVRVGPSVKHAIPRGLKVVRDGQSSRVDEDDERPGYIDEVIQRSRERATDWEERRERRRRRAAKIRRVDLEDAHGVRDDVDTSGGIVADPGIPIGRLGSRDVRPIEE